MCALVQLDIQPPIGVLSLNRPERHNSLTPELLIDLLQALEEVGARSAPTLPEAVRALVLRAEGRSFSTGGDIRGFAEHLETIQEYSHEIVGRLNQAILALLDLPIPLVAAVQGIVTGGSLGLVLACDHVLLAPQASFTPYYSVVGFSPDGGWTAMLPNLIGPRRTAAVLSGNATIHAEQAAAWGMADRVVPAESLETEAYELAQELAKKKPGSLQRTRQLIRQAYGDLPERLDAERRSFVEQIASEEAQKGLLVFLKK
jgi:2-(1,2-epoxy-1,2-dihydrophenyl)acetyl-CoA isomerase